MNVVHNHATHRVVTVCRCGATISLPDSGLSQEYCACGLAWTCDGDVLARFRLERVDEDDDE